MDIESESCSMPQPPTGKTIRPGAKRKADSESGSSRPGPSGLQESVTGNENKTKQTQERVRKVRKGGRISIQDFEEDELEMLLRAFSSEDDSSGSEEDGGENTSDGLFPLSDIPCNFDVMSRTPIVKLETPDMILPQTSLSPTEGPEFPLSQPPKPPAQFHSIKWVNDDPDVPRIPFTGTEELIVVPPEQNPQNYFNLLFNKDFFDLILQETELFAEQMLLKNIRPRGRITDWKTLSEDEFRIWLGLLVHMGHISIPRVEYYWNTSPLYDIKIFQNSMSRDRFLGILQCLHFGKNPCPQDPTPIDRLFKIRPLIDHFNNTMRKILRPGKNLSIDESMVLWRGRQYIKGKKHKFGIKLYILSDPSGLVLRIFVYEGAVDSGDPDHAQKVVHSLVDYFTEKGHSLYMDSFYNSVSLSRELLEKHTYSTGTLHPTRMDNPPDVVNAKLQRGELVHRWSNDGICVFKWKDKREVNFISTEHGIQLVEVPGRRTLLHKPKAVVEYNKFMGGTDKSDQLLSLYYSEEHKSLKWYKRLGIHIFQMMILNSYLLHRRFSDQPRIDLLEFRYRLVRDLLNVTNTFTPRVQKTNKGQQHFLQYTENETRTNKKQQKRCKACQEKKIRSMVTTVCDQCIGNPGFCIPCFKSAHI